VAGEEVSIADLQYFFEITNYVVYERSFSHFKRVSEWFARMQEIP
jgi:glutathione S-transferase